MYRPITVIDTTAKKAHGKPAAVPYSAGIVTMTQHTIIASTDMAGTRWRMSRTQIRQPEIARSRENAYQMRDALVRPAMPQKIWPTVEIRMTISTQPELMALVKTAIELPPPSSTAATSAAAQVMASSTSQPNTAAQNTDCHRPLATLISASWVSSATCAEASWPVWVYIVSR